MKSSLIICFLLGCLLPSIVWASTNDSCSSGECVNDTISRLEELNKLFSKQCLPPNIEKSKIPSHIKKYGVTEICWKYITEIDHLEKKLQDIQENLELRLGCDPGGNTSGINYQIDQLAKNEHDSECSDKKKQQTQSNCLEDLECSLISSALGLGGYLAEKMIPDGYKPKNCHLGDDSCSTQLATSFLKSVFLFFQGSWSILKASGNFTKNKLGEFWNWVSGAEDHSSTYQLGMAKASENESVFQMLLNDFPGTMKKLWHGLISAIKEWLKTDIFCTKWHGTPHFGQCLGPLENFDCMSCKAMVNGICSASGYIIAEIVPAFITGGLVTAAKYGAQGAAKISKLFTISKSGADAIKASRLSSVASAASRAAETTRISKMLKATKTLIDAALSSLKAYLLSPLRSIVKSSYSVMLEQSAKGAVYIQQSKAGKIIIFTKDAAKTMTHAVLYPIDNPMTAFAYKEGQRTFDKIFRFGAPKIADRSTMLVNLISKEPKIETTIAKIRIENFSSKPNAEKIIMFEQELLEKVMPIRWEILRKSFQAEDLNFLDLIENLYPELKYGELAKKLPPERILMAEQELYAEIHFLPDGDHRNKLLQAFEEYTSHGEARSKILTEPFKRPEKLEIIEGAIVTEEQVKKSLNLTRPMAKAAGPSYRKTEEELKKENKEKKK